MSHRDARYRFQAISPNLLRKSTCKAVQKMFRCAFPYFFSIFQKLWIFHQEEFPLGRCKLRRPKGNLILGAGEISQKYRSWAPYVTAPKKDFVLEAYPNFLNDASKNRKCTTKHILHCLIT